MNIPPDRSPGTRVARLLGVFLWFVSGISMLAQIGGTIEGRVLNTRSAEYVERARITIEGAALETFTDADGNYRITHVTSRRGRADGVGPLVATP